MDKLRQRYLLKWLKTQQKPIKKLMSFNLLLASFSSLVLIAQTWMLAHLLEQLIMQHQRAEELMPYFFGLLIGFALRAIILFIREKIGFQAGKQLRNHLRQQILTKIQQVGPATINHKPAGSWASLMLEQVENLHNFYARYLPQQSLSAIVPMIVLIAVFPLNWAAGLILIGTAPLIPIFMILVGIAAADSSQKNMSALARLSAQFLDRLRGLETLRLLNRSIEQTQHIERSTEEFRETTMDVLKMAFLSSAVLEFFTSISIALMAVYFGFSYLGKMDFGTYNTSLSLFVGFFCLILAPEFYQPLRDLGTYYHDRAAGIGAADAIVEFLETDYVYPPQGEKVVAQSTQGIQINGENLVVLSPQGQALTQPLNFQLNANSQNALVGQSGAGKTSLINVLLGFLPYQGSLKINGTELRELDLSIWRNQIAWVGQNPLLLQGTIRENLLLGKVSKVSDEQIEQVLIQANAKEFTDNLGLDYFIKDGGIGLSVGQAQRLAIARALLQERQLLLLDEPTASLDAQSENQVLQSLNHICRQQTSLMITHRIEDLKQCQQILVMRQGQIVQQGDFASLQHQGFFAELLAQRANEVN